MAQPQSSSVSDSQARDVCKVLVNYYPQPVCSMHRRVMQSAYPCICRKILAVQKNASQKCPEKYCCFPFTLRHCECDSQLPVHSRSCVTPVSLLVLVCPLWVVGSGSKMFSMS